MLRFLIILGLAAALASCQPVYETGYRLDPPVGGGEAAQACVASCEAAQAACLIPAREEFAACQNRSVMMQDICRSNAQIDYQTCQRADAPNGATCIFRICPYRPCEPAAINLCEAAYRRCFAGCGGTVVEEQHCVANCPS